MMLRFIISLVILMLYLPFIGGLLKRHNKKSAMKVQAEHLL